MAVHWLYLNSRAWLSSEVLVIPNGDPRDRFFYPTLTLMMNSYIPTCFNEYGIVKFYLSKIAT